MSKKEAWFEKLEVQTIQKRVGRKVDPESVAINKTSISFGTKLIPVFKEAKSIRIDEVMNEDKIAGLIFVPKDQESDGYTIRTPEDRKVIQTSLPKTLRPILEKQDIFGEYRGEVFENPQGYEGKIVAVQFA